MKKLLAVLALAFAFPLPARAQTKMNLQTAVAMDFAAGAGFLFAGEEEAVFDAKALYGAFHWNGLQLPGPNVSTGIGVEIHPSTITTNGSTVNFAYRVWSLNRMDCPMSLFCGADLKIGEAAGPDGGWRTDFDMRIVTGVRVANYSKAEINLELYFLEDDRPVSAAVLVRWGSPGSNQP